MLPRRHAATPPRRQRPARLLPADDPCRLPSAAATHSLLFSTFDCKTASTMNLDKTLRASLVDMINSKSPALVTDADITALSYKCAPRLPLPLHHACLCACPGPACHCVQPPTA